MNFGYQYPFNDVTWADLVNSWASYTEQTWESGDLNAEYENLVAGNQQGYVLILEQSIQNSPSLNITAISGTTFTSENNNLFCHLSSMPCITCYIQVHIAR